MLKRIAAIVTIVSTIGLSALPSIAGNVDRWEYEGIASTGEKVYLNLDSVRFEGRKGYFFIYQIGNDRLFAYTPCDGRFQVANQDGVTFKPLMKAQSSATRRMLDQVCAAPR
ncbi:MULTISPECIES: hypothetical protein [unclassified Phormidesmis]